MTDLFHNSFTRKTLKTMLGNMFPCEMADLAEDPQLSQSDVPKWIERTLRKECKYVIKRLPRYEQKIIEKLGYQPQSLVRRMSVYYQVRDNWDDLEPCNFDLPRPIRCFYDCQIPQDIKDRINRAERRTRNIRNPNELEN